METEKTRKPLRKSDYDRVLREAKTLLDSLTDKEELSKEEEKKLDKLKQVIAILKMLPPLKKKTPVKAKIYDAKKDEEIVRRFVERLKKSGKY